MLKAMKSKISRVASLITLCLLPLLALAQNAGTAAVTPQNFREKMYGTIMLVTGAVVLIAAFLVVIRLLNTIVKMEELRVLREKGLPEVAPQPTQPSENWWQRFVAAATGTTKTDRKELVLDGDFDGIRQLDNPPPPWWQWAFYATIAFAVGYWAVYHFGSGPTLQEAYAIEMKTAQDALAARLAAQPAVIDENTVTLLTDDAELSLGETIFQTNCVLCHGQAGEGNAIGPNLTDQYWINGGSIQNVFGVVSNGVIEKGMQSWKNQLRPVDIQRVSSFILAKLQGTNPPNAKEPQGDLWQPETTPAQDGTGI